MEQIPEEVKELVIARLDVLPEDRKISIGSGIDLTKKQLIFHVKESDAIGREIVDMEMGFLKALAQGTLLEDISAAISAGE